MIAQRWSLWVERVGVGDGGPNSMFQRISSKSGRRYPYTVEIVMGLRGWGLGGCFFLHISTKLSMWYPYTPVMVMRVRDESGGNQIPFSAHLNQIWRSVSLHPRDCHGCWGFKSGEWGVVTKFVYSASQQNLASGVPYTRRWSWGLKGWGDGGPNSVFRSILTKFGIWYSCTPEMVIRVEWVGIRDGEPNLACCILTRQRLAWA